MESWVGVLQTVQEAENQAEGPKGEVQSAAVALTLLQEKLRGMGVLVLSKLVVNLPGGGGNWGGANWPGGGPGGGPLIIIGGGGPLNKSNVRNKVVIFCFR